MSIVIKNISINQRKRDKLMLNWDKEIGQYARGITVENKINQG